MSADAGEPKALPAPAGRRFIIAALYPSFYCPVKLYRGNLSRRDRLARRSTGLPTPPYQTTLIPKTDTWPTAAPLNGTIAAQISAGPSARSETRRDATC